MKKSKNKIYKFMSQKNAQLLIYEILGRFTTI